MGAMEVERLVLKSAFVKESLSKSDAMTTEMINILSSFDEQLSSLEAAMRPTQIRTHALTKAHQNIDSTLHAAESVLAQFDVSRQVEPRLLEGPRGDFDGYFAAVDQLQTAVDFFTQNRGYKSSDAALRHAKGLLGKALGNLEEEFRRMLSANSNSQDPAALFALLPEKYKPAPASSNSETTVSATSRKPAPEPQPLNPPETVETLQLLPANVIPQLHGMAKQLLAGGFSQQCTKGYKDVRGATILQSLKRLGLEKLTREEVQKMQWEVLETKIGSWIQYLRIAVKLLLASERKLCDQVFYRLDPDRTAVFCEVAAESMAMLLSFGDSVAKSKKSPEKLFVLLDMYETLRDLMPDVDVTFAGEACATIREAAKGLLKRVAETALGTFAEFEEAVEKDVSKHSVADGTVHPLTTYVINYVKYLLDYQATLKELFGEGDVDKQASQLAVATTRIMAVLQQNLDGKSKAYKTPALTSLFMMNNMHYMVRSVKRSEARELLGDDWVQRHRRTVQQHATAYQRSSWGKVTTLLTGQGLQANGQEGAVNRQAVKDRFKAFNTTFEELYAAQTQWHIPDPELREAVRLQVAEVLLPAYRSFLKRYGSILEGGKNPGKYIKYAPEDLERMLGDFFEGGNRR